MRVAARLLIAAAALVALPGTSAGAAGDPCGHRAAPHLSGKLHCGGVFAVPAGKAVFVPRSRWAPPCPTDRMITAVPSGPAWFAIGGLWNYWTENSDKVQATGDSKSTLGHRGQPLDIDPKFHNWDTGHAWHVRVFFRCTKLPSK